MSRSSLRALLMTSSACTLTFGTMLSCRTRSFSEQARSMATPNPPPQPSPVSGVTPVTDWATALGQLLSKHPKVTVLGLGETTHANGEFNAVRFSAWEGLRASHGVRTMFLEECLTGSWRIHRRKKDPSASALSLLDEFDRSAFTNSHFLSFLEKARQDEDLRMHSAPLVVGVDPQGIFRCDPSALPEIFAPMGKEAAKAITAILAFAARYADPDATLGKLTDGTLLLETLESDFASYESAVDTLDSLTAALLRPDVSADIAPTDLDPNAASIELRLKEKRTSVKSEDPARTMSPYADLDESEVARAFARVAVVQLRSRLSFFSPFTEEFRLLRRPAFNDAQKVAYDRALLRASNRLRGPLAEAARDEGMALSIIAWQDALGPARAKGIFWAHAAHVARATFGASAPGTPLGFYRAGGHLQRLINDAYMGLALDGSGGRFKTLRVPDAMSFASFPEVKSRSQVEAFLTTHEETCNLPAREHRSPLRSALERAALAKGSPGALFSVDSDVLAARSEYEMLMFGAGEGSCQQVLSKSPYVRMRLGEQFDGVALLPLLSPADTPLGPRAIARLRDSIERTRKALSEDQQEPSQSER